MPSFQARKDQLSRSVWSEALPSSPRCTRDLSKRSRSESSPSTSACDNLLRLVPNASRREGTDPSSVRPRCYRSNPDARRGCRPMDLTGCSRLLERANQCGIPTTQALITSLRAFLRFLNFRGEFRDDLALAIPAVAHWRL